MTLKERFESKIYYGLDGCWYSLSSLSGKFNRARISVNGINRIAARVSYELYIGELPAHFLVLHTCDNPQCVNPYHLFLGTHADNRIDMVNKGRSRHITKLTEMDVVSIRASSGVRKSVLAKKFNIHRSTVCNIIKRRIWAHIA